MITFTCIARVRPGKHAAFEDLMTRVRDLTRANEPGVAHYDFGRSVEEPDTYLVLEVYRDAAAHALHMDMPWVKDAIVESRRLLEAGSDIRQYASPGTAAAVRRLKEA